ncbi:MAG: phenylalanine--tRNA ligase subunit beta [Actinobacteria bacterium]|nr:phenylalanine--tRNA ligase subunit beta [Actinomycetota bacterium]
MRAPVSWLREYAAIPEDLPARELAAALVRVGMEVEAVDTVGEGLTGPLVLGRVADITELTEFKKPIRYCQVELGSHGVRGIICGATNFAVGDLVPVALPGTVLPGGFAIAARKTYGHLSDGMICSASELGLGDESDGILVLPPDSGSPGDDARAQLGIGEAVLDIAVTPDRGYCLSIRGLAREAATALGVDYADPALSVDLTGYPGSGPEAPRVVIDSPDGCSEFTAVALHGFDPTAQTPAWLAARLAAAGMRSISLAVDVTNYVMLELGQPLHAFDADKVVGTIVVRRARAGEVLRTLDHVDRTLHPDDLVIADDTGPIGLAGTMGGYDTEISPGTTTVLLEAAHFAPTVVARMARRHKLPSEASKRFEREVDPGLPWIASKRAADLMISMGGGSLVGGAGVGTAGATNAVAFDPSLPARIAGTSIPDDEVRQHLREVGCAVDDAAVARWLVTAPSWRPDLRDPADLVEEVVRLHGYDRLPATLPSPPASHGLTANQRRRRSVSKALAGAGWIEVLDYPFVGESELEELGIDDHRAQMVRLANPLSDEQSGLRTSLLPGLVTAARRNLSRGADGVLLYEMGLVFMPRDEPAQPFRPGVAGPPSPAELAALERLLPEQPLHVAAVAAGVTELGGWWGAARRAAWYDALAAAQTAARSIGVELEVEQAVEERAPWHPGRCAVLRVGGTVVGYAGELHPRVVESLGLPPRSAAMELNLDTLFAGAPAVRKAPNVSTFPVAKEDIALVVDEQVPAAQVRTTVVRGAGDLLESVRLFDEYRGSQIPPGKKSLAFSLRFRADDRTLSDAEVSASRDAAVAAAAEAFGAELRSG